MIDHLIWAVPQLDAGIDELERRSGVRAEPGGSHPGFGTRNAVAELGGGGYLELLALDPQQSERRSFGRWLDGLRAPRLLSWAIRTDNPGAVAAAAEGLGLVPEPVVELRRQMPNGGTFRARLLMLGGHDFGRLMPFFVERLPGSRPPTAGTAPRLRLDVLEIEHRQASELRRLLGHLAADLRLAATEAEEARMTARLDTPNGPLRLDS